MVREAREAGQSVLLSSHILTEIQHTADDVAVLAGGKIIAHGDVSSLRLSSVTRLRALLADTTAEAVRPALAALPTLQDIDAEATASGESVRLSATIRGDVDHVVKALAQFTVRDLTVEEPDLEESILDLYSRTNGKK